MKTVHPQENPVPELNRLYAHSSRSMHELPDGSVHLMVTSPPYNVGKDYDEDMSVEEYRRFLREVWAETYRVLVHGGRACINVANVGRRPYLSLSAFVTADMIDAGFLMRGQIIWNKQASAGSSCAWGSWRSPSNPVLRDVHEYILVFCKGDFARPKPECEQKQATIGRDDFLEWTKSVWEFPAESAKKVKHPAPFPVELPARCIQLYTYSNDVVLDPVHGQRHNRRGRTGSRPQLGRLRNFPGLHHRRSARGSVYSQSSTNQFPQQASQPNADSRQKLSQLIH